MAETQLTVGDLIVQLRALASQNPCSKSELESLESASTALLLQLRNSAAIPTLPEIVWHFLTDADVRFKDPLYASSQLAAMAHALSELELSAAT